MKLKYLSSVVSPSNEIACAGALCYAPNGRKFAVGTADRHVLLFDDKLRRRDKFSTKPVDAKYGKSGYAIRCAAFSPDSTKLAIGQTDHIVFVYRLGESWDEKKVICNKFAQSAAVIALLWPSESKMVVGLLDGKVRLASASSNKCSTLYRAESAVCALAQHPSRKSFLSGHEDGAIYLFSFDTRSHSRVCLHSCGPYALLLSNVGCILAAGSDRRLVSYTEQGGRVLQQFDYSRADKEFTMAALDSSGHNAVFGTFDKIHLMCWNQRRGAWDEGGVLSMQNMYTITGFAWKSDGSTLLCANMLGGVISIDCAVRKTLLHNRFELTFVSPSQAIVRDLKATDSKREEEQQESIKDKANSADAQTQQQKPSVAECVLRSRRGAELGEVRVLGREQRYALAYTPSTLILADIWTGLSSEIAWQSGGNEKFYLDNENVAFIVNAGEINFVEYGRDELAGWIRTERTNPHQISVRLRRLTPKQQQQLNNPDSSSQVPLAEIRRVAYLLDARTISIVDLAKNNQQIAQIHHGSPIDWLELNERANKLLFRDILSALHLFSLDSSGQTMRLIGHCSYVQWVPQSDVVVAQSNDQLCVWYNTDEHADRVVQFPIQGEVEMVARDASRTEVIVLENNTRVAYELDSAMIEFGTAVDELDLGRAVLFLEQSEQRGVDVQAMWRKLAAIALEHSQLMVAQRCFASLNDLVRVQFLQNTLLRAERQFGAPLDDAALADHFEVRARLAMMAKQFKLAERIWLENNALTEAIDMWRRLGQWESALELARAMNFPEIDTLRVQYERYLQETGQQEKIAEMKMRDGDPWTALGLFVQANQPAQAVQLLLQNRHMLDQLAAKREAEEEEEDGGGMLDRLCQALDRHELFDKAGELYEALGQQDRAMDYYRQGHLYGKAIQISRIHFPDRVVQLEEQWADWLFSQANYDVAVPHFLESGNTVRAVDSAIRGREWTKALEILKAVEPSAGTALLYGQIARHFELAGQLEMAEPLYVEAGELAEAVEMYNKTGRWAEAFRLAAQFFGEDQSRQLYADKATQLAEEKKFADAEKLFIALDEPNQAIAMYKQADRAEDMMRLMGQFHAGEVQTAHKHLAEELERKGDLREAEEQFLLAGDWAAAVDMYQQAEQWTDAHRLAKAHGDPGTQRQIVYLWAKGLGGDAAVKLLARQQLLEEAIGMAVAKSDFDFAFDLCRLGAGHRLQFVQQKYAERLEDGGELEKAEENYLKAGKAREAVLMYMHSQHWEAAERIAQEHCADQLPDLFVQRARVCLEQRDFARAESFLLRANRPDIILAFYRESALWPEALRIAKDYLPDQLEQCQTDYEEFQLRSGAKGAQSLVAQAREWERQNEYRRAVDCWMRVDGNTQDQQLLAQALAKAAELTVKFLADSEEGIELLGRIAQRQLELRQFLAAGETFLLASRPAESIQALLDAHEWAKAKRVAEELAPELEQMVEDTYRQFLRSHGRIGELIDVDVVAAIDMLVQAGQWEKALATAKHQNNRHLLDKYLALYANELLAQDQFEPLLAALRKFGSSPNPQLLPIYGTLVEKLTNARPNAHAYETSAALRDVLLEVSRQLTSADEHSTNNSQTIQMFERYLHLAHFCTLRTALDLVTEQQEEQQQKMAAGGLLAELNALRLRLSVAMLRYIEPLRADKAFYEAGSACKLWGGPEYESMAFLLLNQLLDISDAIDEADPNLVDNGLFEGTDVPTSYSLPTEKYLNEAELDEVKEWVLAISVGHTVDKQLRLDDRDSYEASQVDSLGNTYPICAISGYPIIDEGQELGPGRVADRRAWATLMALVKQTSTDELLDVQHFLSNWSSE